MCAHKENAPRNGRATWLCIPVQCLMRHREHLEICSRYNDELMSIDELSAIDEMKCILQFRWVRLPLIPGVHLSDNDAERLKAFARKGVGIDEHADEYKKKITALEGSIRDMDGQINSLQQDIRSIARDRNTWTANYERLWLLSSGFCLFCTRSI